MSTIGIEEKIAIEIDWTKEDLILEGIEPFIDFSNLFNECSTLQIARLDFEAVEMKKLHKMFAGCSSLKILKISIITINVIDKISIFYQC